jgi:hypothetical protein
MRGIEEIRVGQKDVEVGEKGGPASGVARLVARTEVLQPAFDRGEMIIRGTEAFRTGGADGGKEGRDLG